MKESRRDFLVRKHKLRSRVFGVPMTANTYREHDPLISEGLGCMKAQVPEMRAAIHKRNIQGVKVLDSGQLRITSRRGRKEVAKMRGLADADAGYGD